MKPNPITALDGGIALLSDAKRAWQAVSEPRCSAAMPADNSRVL